MIDLIRRGIGGPHLAVEHDLLAVELTPLFRDIVDGAVVLVEREAAHRLEIDLLVSVAGILDSAGQLGIEIEVHRVAHDEHDHGGKHDQPEVDPFVKRDFDGGHVSHINVPPYTYFTRYLATGFTLETSTSKMLTINPSSFFSATFSVPSTEISSG